MAGNFRSVSFGKMLQPKMDCRHIVKSAVMFMPETVRKLREGGNLKKIYSNPELAKFSPRELIAELKARGYTGKLRLLVTTKCPNKCPMCCNNSWDFSKLPVVEHFNYKEIMITGGEPLLFPEKLANLAESIKTVQKLAYGNKGKLFLYTALADMLPNYIRYFDGVVYTPHSVNDIHSLLEANIFCWITKMNLWKVNLFGSIFFLILKSIFLTTQTFRYGK